MNSYYLGIDISGTGTPLERNSNTYHSFSFIITVSYFNKISFGNIFCVK